MILSLGLKIKNREMNRSLFCFLSWNSMPHSWVFLVAFSFCWDFPSYWSDRIFVFFKTPCIFCVIIPNSFYFSSHGCAWARHSPREVRLLNMENRPTLFQYCLVPIGYSQDQWSQYSTQRSLLDFLLPTCENRNFPSQRLFTIYLWFQWHLP
jgi:hypothetical protein